MNGRIYGAIEKIDQDKVKSFFEARFCKENPLASVMVRANPNDDIAEKRNLNELNKLRSLFDFNTRPTILDVGCGCGRWATNLNGSYSKYCGIDFCENYIQAAQKLFEEVPNTEFKRISATEINENTFSGKFDLVIINGLCMYLNDNDLERVITGLTVLTNDNATIYIRESVSEIGERLTLKNFPSAELQTDYNAVYRTPAEYEKLFVDRLKSFRIRESGLLTNPEIWQRKETNQRFWLLKAI